MEDKLRNLLDATGVGLGVDTFELTDDGATVRLNMKYVAGKDGKTTLVIKANTLIAVLEKLGSKDCYERFDEFINHPDIRPYVADEFLS